jgi:hypothetical protein
VKNAPAVTARRATNQIVLAEVHQALAATAVVSLPAAAAETLAMVVVVVIVLAEQTVRVVTTRLTDHVVMAHRLIDRAAMATGHTRPVPPVTAMRDHAVMELRLIDLVAMVRPLRRARLAIVPIPRGLHAMEIVHIRLDPHVTEILDRHGPAATAPTRLVLLAMVIHVRVAMARTALVSLVAMAIRAAGPHVAMVIHLPGHHGPAAIDPIQRVPLVTEILGLRVPGETVPIRRAPRATARVQIVREAIAPIVHAPIALTATSHAVNGSPMGESVVRSARR